MNYDDLNALALPLNIESDHTAIVNYDDVIHEIAKPQDQWMLRVKIKYLHVLLN